MSEWREYPDAPWDDDVTFNEPDVFDWDGLPDYRDEPSGGRCPNCEQPRESPGCVKALGIARLSPGGGLDVRMGSEPCCNPFHERDEQKTRWMRYLRQGVGEKLDAGAEPGSQKPKR